MSDQENPTRRKFYVGVINVLGAVITAALALPAAAYLLIKPQSQDSGEYIEVADLNQLVQGKPEEVVYRRTRVDGWKRMEEKTTTWVVKTSDKTIAFSPACTHLGCAYHWDDEIQNFLCPCHTSVFSVDGSVVSGPAPRPLDRYVVKTVGGKLLISQKLEKSDRLKIRAMLKTILNWVDERSGLVSAIHHFLDEDIPASAGWHQVLGSVAMFAFLTQIFSGLLMAVNYAPTPSEAWDSLRYVVTQATAGGLMRSLHHWGASAMIVVVVLHMVQAALYGAYKKPREMTWMVGVVMLLLTLAFGLSGYLLAWDNRAYWGTMVTTRITSLAPGGALLLTLLGTDGNSIGRQTFSRFYAAHVTLLPLVMLGLVVLHVYLVRKHGVTPAPGDENLPKKKFFPEQVYKDTVGTFIWFAVVALMVAYVKVPLGHAADPTDTGYNPRPEWYFLFLFQILKAFNGPLEVFGAIVLPGLAVGSLFLLPFIDRGKMLRLRQRTGAIAVVAVAALGWTALTARAIATTPTTMEEDGLAEVRSWQQIPASQLTGIEGFRKDNCKSCHALDGTGSGPDLTKAVSRRPNDWLEKHFQQPEDIKGPASTLNGSEVRGLITLVTQRDERGLDAWKNAPDEVVKGASVYIGNQCGSCHTLNDEGGKRGPVLNGLKQRRERSWVIAHFSDPKKFSPNSLMPAYKLKSPDLELLTTYLMSIPR